MEPRRILLFIIVAVLAAYAWHRYETRHTTSFTPATSPRVSADDVKMLAQLDAERVKLVDSVVPSVVSITSSSAMLQRQQITLEDVFQRRQRMEWAKSTSLGSGVIVSKEGHILTNHHVIANKTEIHVQLTDGRNIAARLIGSDPTTDIAVLKVDEGNLVPLPLGNSDDLRAGQEVLAVGNPYGFQETVSRGIVSSNGRRALSEDGMDFIQHDAAVNQGNSGGPLLNLRGEIVGINSRIFSQTGGWQGISFAIPAKTAKEVMQKILTGGGYAHRYFGAEGLTVTRRTAASVGLDIPGGVLIGIPEPNSPAARAGLAYKDIILSFDGKTVTDTDSFAQAMAATEAGRTVKVGFLRNGAPQETKIALTDFAPDLPRAER